VPQACTIDKTNNITEEQASCRFVPEFVMNVEISEMCRPDICSGHQSFAEPKAKKSPEAVKRLKSKNPDFERRVSP